MTHLDLFLSHPGQPGKLYNVQTVLVRGFLMFKPTILTWNEDRQENDEQETIPLDAPAFGAWYQTRMLGGWVIQAT